MAKLIVAAAGVLIVAQVVENPTPTDEPRPEIVDRAELNVPLHRTERPDRPEIPRRAVETRDFRPDVMSGEGIAE